MMSDNSHVILNKFINGFGAVSLGAGATLGAVATSIPADQSFWQSNLPLIAGIVSIIGGLTFIAKNMFDMYLSWRKKDK